MIDRLAPRRRPSGCPVLHQRWHGLLFLHWECDPQALRARLPAGLALDCFDGRAWVGMTPFGVSRIRPSLLPPLPVASEALEINVRVYVERDGVPGIWFPSLEISNRLARTAARLAYGLPYFHAAMREERHGERVRFRSERREGPPAALDVEWQVGARLASPRPGTLEDFLIERYVLYSVRGGRLLRARIHHRPWPLREARVLRLQSTLAHADGLPAAAMPVLAHAQAEPLDVAVWAPRAV